MVRARQQWFAQADRFVYLREHPVETNAEGHRQLLAAVKLRLNSV